MHIIRFDHTQRGFNSVQQCTMLPTCLYCKAVTQRQRLNEHWLVWSFRPSLDELKSSRNHGEGLSTLQQNSLFQQNGGVNFHFWGCCLRHPAFFPPFWGISAIPWGWRIPKPNLQNWLQFLSAESSRESCEGERCRCGGFWRTLRTTGAWLGVFMPNGLLKVKNNPPD